MKDMKYELTVGRITQLTNETSKVPRFMKQPLIIAKLQAERDSLLAENQALRAALIAIERMEARADGVRGFVDDPHVKALRSACKLARTVLKGAAQ